MLNTEKVKCHSDAKALMRSSLKICMFIWQIGIYAALAVLQMGVLYSEAAIPQLILRLRRYICMYVIRFMRIIF